MPLPPVLNSIVTWLRAGYPEGVPDVDYVPLFALLASELTNDDVNAIAQELESASDPQSARAIKEAITTVTAGQASDADVARVRAGWRAAAGRWPSRTTSSRASAAAPGQLARRGSGLSRGLRLPAENGP